MSIHDDKDRSCGADSQPLKEGPKDTSIDCAFMHHEPRLTTRSYRRDHVHCKAAARFLDHWRLARWRPSRASVIVRAQSRLVGEVDGSPHAARFRADSRVDFALPATYQLRVLLPGFVKRLLSCETKHIHNPAHRGQRQALAQPAMNELTDQRQGPKRVRKFHLLWCFVADDARKPSHFLGTHFGWTPWLCARLHRALPALNKARQPAEKCSLTNSETFCYVCNRAPVTNRFDCLHTSFLALNPAKSPGFT